MAQSEKLLTFIVPAYNAEKYLKECIDSLLNQTVSDHKIVLVNDGSTDHTGEIGRDYAEKFPDVVTYLEQENRGLGAARNRGLALVNTKYVTFLDSDDYQDCMFVEKLRKELKRHENTVDIVFTLPHVFDNTTGKLLPWKDKTLFERLFYLDGGYEDVVSVELNTQSRYSYRLYDLEASACRCVFRTAFLHTFDYCFAEGVKWEDVWPHFTSIHHAKCCIAMRSAGFIYRINTAGQITSGGGASRLDVAKVFTYALEQAKKEKWLNEEFAHIIHVCYDFTKWTISVTNRDYIVPVLDSLHGLFRSIPKNLLKAYYRNVDVIRRDRVVIWTLRSPFYKVFRDYRYRQMIWAFLQKLYQVRNKFRR